MDKQIHRNTGLGYALLHFYLYSSLHIALCAMAITAYSYLTLPHHTLDFNYISFVGASTLLLYSLHRIIGIKKSASYSEQGRFAIIIKYKSHLIFYSIGSAIYCLYVYYNFDWNRRLHLIAPVILSLSYSLPIFYEGKRLRDFHWIKIFLVSICWAVITCTIPFYEVEGVHNGDIILMTLERALFIFAITIPFDIRDREVDSQTNVRTLATKYSNHKLKCISWLALIVAGVISILLYTQDIYSSITMTPVVLTYLISAYLVHLTNGSRSDYFFTGMMDGLMALPLILLFIHVWIGFD